MILAIDAYYYADKAKICGLTFEKWIDTRPSKIHTIELKHPADYESGNFYKRELPGILKLLDQIDCSGIEYLLIDGYVFLNQGRKGLGRYLYDQIHHKIPVIGIAKSLFAGNSEYVIPVYRGKSKHPLYISSVGIEAQKAAIFILSMAGPYRIPALLKRLDQETRK